MDRLAEIPNVVDIRELESTEFQEKYVLEFKQPINHYNPSYGSFTQRVFVCNVHPDSSTVLVTEGYGAQYAALTGYRDELSKIFNTNLIVVEHRYFLESTPKDKNWEFLTTYNSAHDLHNVTTALKTIYDKKWISTGISKGGQTSLLYRVYFPDDVDISVPYVAPLCKSVTDGRHEIFLMDFVGTPEERQTIEDFQIEFLKRRETILPLFDSIYKAKSHEFNLPLNQIFDYCVLEFPFALWQWGTPVSTIPKIDASDREYFNTMMAISSPDYFINKSPITPFFVQAAKELGYYGYTIKPFKKYLYIKNTKDYLARIFLPENVSFYFDDTLYNRTVKFIRETDSKMLFIYGEFDPWSAVMIENPGTENIKIFIDPKGSHRARISTFPEGIKEEIISTLSNWLYN